MDRGQLFGGVLGLVTLLSAFLLPFSSIAEGKGGGIDSLIFIFKLFVTTLPNIQAVAGLTQLTQLAYVYMTGFVLIVLAGIIGAYPRWSAILGLASMALLTAAPFAIFSTYTFDPSTYGVGFWAIWATSSVSLVAAYWSWRERAKVIPKQDVPPPRAVPQATPAAA